MACLFYIVEMASMALPIHVLPQEIWYRILTYLDGQSLKQVMIADERVDNMLDEELFWFKKCQNGQLNHRL